MPDQHVTPDSREARFLASRAERRADRYASNEGSASPSSRDDEGSNIGDQYDDFDRKEQTSQFWNKLRKIFSQINHQLDSLLSPFEIAGDSERDDTAASLATYYATAARRNEGREKLEFVLANVRLLSSFCLSSSSSLAVGGGEDTFSTNVSIPSLTDDPSENSTEGLIQQLILRPLPQLTATDSGLIRNELNDLEKKGVAVKKIVSPKEKFVFRRYRRAMKEKLERDKLAGDAGDPIGVFEKKSESETKQNTQFFGRNNYARENGTKSNLDYGGIVENLSNCVVEAYSDGTINLSNSSEEAIAKHRLPLSHFRNGEIATEGRKRNQEDCRGNSHFLLKNLNNVTLLLNAPHKSPIQSLHLQNIKESNIIVCRPIEGPVHITDCHFTRVRCSAYQLRVHESTFLRFGVWVRSGPIIEDCTGMIFSGDYYEDASDTDSGEKVDQAKNMYWDVKDFNWLRNLKKSPNFTIETQTVMKDKKKFEGEIVKAEVSVEAKPNELEYVQDDDTEDEL